MNYLIKVPLFVVMFLFGQTLLAGPGGDHSHDHGHESGPITSEQAVKKASIQVQKLVKKGKIDASWSGVAEKSVEEKSYGHGPEWVVTFQNKSIEDSEMQTLYVFYTISGKYIASNFTGQ